MYRLLIYVVVAFLIGGAGYYFHSAGVPDLVVSDIKNDDRRGSGVSAVEVFAGVYTCDYTSGCENPVRIVLGQDTTLDIIITVDGEDRNLAQGTWGVGGGGALVFKFRGDEGFSTSSPSSLIVRKASMVRISDFSNKALYPGIVNPVFTRVEDHTGSTVSN